MSPRLPPLPPSLPPSPHHPQPASRHSMTATASYTASAAAASTAAPAARQPALPAIADATVPTAAAAASATHPRSRCRSRRDPSATAKATGLLKRQYYGRTGLFRCAMRRLAGRARPAAVAFLNAVAEFAASSGVVCKRDLLGMRPARPVHGPLPWYHMASPCCSASACPPERTSHVAAAGPPDPMASSSPSQAGHPDCGQKYSAAAEVCSHGVTSFRGSRPRVATLVPRWLRARLDVHGYICMGWPA